MRPVLALTQGDPVGVGPEILLKVVADRGLARRYHPLLICERAAIEPLRTKLPRVPWQRLRFLDEPPTREGLERDDGSIPVLDPLGEPRTIEFGRPSPEDARGAVAALELGVELALAGTADALVTAPINKATIARWVDLEFRGHTDWLARRCGLERYGRDYLMAFLGPTLRVALLSTHLPLRRALDEVRQDTLEEALDCLSRNVAGSIAVAGLNPHAGEGGLLGDEEVRILEPAIAAARARGLDVHGPISPDTVFLRARRGEFEWVLALYHDQGLIAVKTLAFGAATNWTLGLPILRTSVDHGTAYELAGRGEADESALRAVVETTLRLVAEREAEEGLLKKPRGR